MTRKMKKKMKRSEMLRGCKEHFDIKTRMKDIMYIRCTKELVLYDHNGRLSIGLQLSKFDWAPACFF